MNITIEKLLLEIMSYSNTRKLNDTDIYIRKAHEKLGDKDFNIRAGNLLSWIDPRRYYKALNLEKYIIYEDFMDLEDFKEIYKEYELLFKNIPELKEIFELKEQHIEFNSSLTKSEIQEIYQFVKDNFIINPLHITRYIRSNSD